MKLLGLNLIYAEQGAKDRSSIIPHNPEYSRNQPKQGK
jgi:hypothetical protein